MDTRKVPKVWPRAVGVDPFGAYIAAVWVAWDPEDKKLHVYQEYHEPFGDTTTDHAKSIIAACQGQTIWRFVGGGPSERQQRVDFTGAGLTLHEPPNIGVWPGIDRINLLLKHNVLIIHSDCEKLISEIGEYRRKMTRAGEPTDQIENKDAFHLLDSLRYVIAWLLRTESTILKYLPVPTD